jgi:uncharacterized cupredoxin-like copper-binding protein
MGAESVIGIAGLVFLTGIHGLAVAHEGEHGKAAPTKSAGVEQTSFGQSGDPQKVTRTINVDMNDNFRYTPATIAIRKGETVRIVAHNSGALLHEIVIGSEQDLREHADLMKKFPTMEHEAAYMAHVPPGKTKEIVWQFTKPGNYKFGCLVAGHFEAGMVGDISVSGSGTPMIDGEIRKVDKEAGKITIRHDAIPNLAMPGMTMVFRAAEPALLDRVKPGDKVRFNAETVNGAITVTAIEAVQ